MTLFPKTFIEFVLDSAMEEGGPTLVLISKHMLSLSSLSDYALNF